MSHVTKLKSVPIRDGKALLAAVKELQKLGVKCELEQNAKPRLWSDSQAQQLGDCEYVLRLKDARFDVGFKAEYEEKNGRKVLKQYNAYTDTYGGSVAKAIGMDVSQLPKGTSYETAAMARLSQLYTKHATLNQARAMGYSARQIKQSADGSLQIVLAQTGM